MSYLLHVLFMVCLYWILGSSLNLVLGYAGMLSLCHAAFYGIGAYVSALLMVKAGWPFGPSLVAAIAAAGLAAGVVAAAAVRFRGDFFVLATMGFQVIIYSVLYNWTALTNGAYGVSGIPKPGFLGAHATSMASLLAVAAAAAALTWLVAWRLSRSAYGRVLQAVRDDELAAQALGKDPPRLRRSVFAISAMLAAVAGALYAGYTGYIDPTSFGVDEAIFILSAVVVGGAGNLRGPLAGALLLVLLPEALRFVPLPDAVAANSRQALYGLLLVLAMRFRPRGIAGRYAFE